MDNHNGSYQREEVPPPQAKLRHDLSAAERQHLAEVKAQLDELIADILKMKGAIWDKQNEISLMRRHLTFFLGHMATNAGLPMGAVLSPDGASLIAREG